ncbi:hypothetical protein DY218_15665, partial [Streptomyces triticagri]
MRAKHRAGSRPRRRIAAVGSATVTAAAVLLLSPTPAAHATAATAHPTPETAAAHPAAGPLALGSAAVAGAAGVA